MWMVSALDQASAAPEVSIQTHLSVWVWSALSNTSAKPEKRKENDRNTKAVSSSCVWLHFTVQSHPENVSTDAHERMTESWSSFRNVKKKWFIPPPTGCFLNSAPSGALRDLMDICGAGYEVTADEWRPGSPWRICQTFSASQLKSELSDKTGTFIFLSFSTFQKHVGNSLNIQHPFSL